MSGEIEFVPDQSIVTPVETDRVAELWDSYDKALTALGAVWIDDGERWEIPVED